ncbi:MAG: TIGR04086 family membrane protein [Ruminococcus sp.]|nr:TIGR04086 family membrane protein [Ruminococcus sp.]
MIKKGKPVKRKENSINNRTKIFIKAQILALIVYSAFFIVASVIMYSSDMDKAKGFYAAIAAFAISSFVCGFYSGFKIHKNGLYVGLLFALPANAIVTLISLIINSLNIDFTLAITVAILLISSMLGGVVSVNTKLKAK